MTTPVPADLADPALYVNRELSLLEFNRRVLEQAKDPRTPILERLRFLSISSTNLDEFFEIRVAGLKQQIAYDIQQIGPDGLSPHEVLRRIHAVARGLVAEQYRVLNEELLPALAAQGIEIFRRTQWSPRQKRWIRRYFTAQVLPVLTPMAIDPAHPFPRVLNKGLSFLVTVEGLDAFGRSSGIAVLQVPRSLPRLIRLPEEVSETAHAFVMLSSLIHEHMEDLFPGMQVTGSFQFRVTRNSDLWVDEEEVDNLLQALEGELLSRKYAEAVRLEVADTCTEEMERLLLQNFSLAPEDLYRVNGPVNLHRLATVYDLVARPDLKYPLFVPGTRRRIKHSQDMFEVLSRGDVLLHHPYESFSPVVQLVQQAATDPDVLAIKMTVYRTEADSPLTQALIDAARAGKEVTAVVELRARFDEAANIDLATRLQEAGANVVYGVVGYKAHAKMLLVVRRERGRLRRYVHLGTGNYHPGTARAYTDLSLMTSARDVGLDVHKVFHELTGMGQVTRLQGLLRSPFTLQDSLLQLIDQERRNAQAGKPAHIVARINALAEPEIIRSLYEASRAGVSIDLIVRGVCCLRPGIPGVSENIRVRSIVGRFLEHSRVFYFHADGEELTFCSSADWMQRNFFRRVEVAFPIRDARLRKRVLHEALELALRDNDQAWILGQDGSYVRSTPREEGPHRSQELLMELLGDSPPGRIDAQSGPASTTVLTEDEELSQQLSRRFEDQPSVEFDRLVRQRRRAKQEKTAKRGQVPSKPKRDAG